MMNIVHNTTDYHKGVLAAGVLFGIAYIYSFPLSVAVAACVISDDEVEQMALSSDDSFLNGIGKKHEWQGDSMPYNHVPTYSNVLEPGGHVPTGNNFVGSLLSPKLTEAVRTEHIATLQENSHWPDQIDEAESSRRKVLVFESALAPVLITEDAEVLKQAATQINMDFDSMVHAGYHGQRYIREFGGSNGGDLGFAHHNVSDRMKLMMNICRNKNRQFSWKHTFREIRNVVDCQMNGKVVKLSQICISLSMDQFFGAMET